MNAPLPSIHSLAIQLGELLQSKRWLLTAAESCTGGSLSATITEISGSSGWFDRGFITYSNAAKVSCLDIPADVLNQHGAVSEVIAIAMANGALKKSPQAQISIAITGIAGPDGGSKEKPVGTVWIACSTVHQSSISKLHHFVGNRPAVRHQAVLQALLLLIEQLS